MKILIVKATFARIGDVLKNERNAR